MAIKVYSPVDFEDTSSGLSIDGDFAVDTNTFFVDVSTNRVGIGTTSPTTKLDVNGTVTISGPSAVKWKYSDNYAYFGIGYISGADYGFYNYNYGRADLYIQQSSGNVGIGTTSPTAKLDVNGEVRFRDGNIRGNSSFDFLTTGGAAQQARFKGIQVSTGYSGNPPSNGILFGTDTNLYRSAANTLRTSDSLVVDSNVLIGTTTDSGDKLKVSGNISSTGTISVNNRTAISVAHWSSVGDSTGAIRITLPGSHGGNWSMLVLRITAYEYNSNNHTVYYVSGHDWTSGWYQNGVTKMGDSDKDISLGYDSNYDYVILGGVSSTWRYGHVTVDVVAHPSFYSSSMNIRTGWSIAQTTSLSGVTVQQVNNRKVLTNADEGSGNGIDADTVDGVEASSFLRSDTDDATTGTLTIGDGSNQARLLIKKADNNTANHIEFYNGTTRVGEIGATDDTWLRINNHTSRNIYTPRYIRADGGFFVDGTSKGINGSGNFIGGTITGASDANVSNWNTAYGWGDHASAGYLTAHPNISAAASSNNSGRDFIQDIFVDGNGHILGIGTAQANTIIGTDSDINTSGATIIDNIYVTDGVITSMGTRTLTAADLGISQPNPPTITATNVVGETIEVVFNQSPTSNIDYYQVWSSVNGGSYGMIAQIPQSDIAATMTVIDAEFSVSGTMSYRVYAVKNGIYSNSAQASQAFTAPTLDVVNMSVVNLNTAYYIQYNMPDSRFVDHIEIYMDSEASSGSLSRTGATLVYSGNNTSYMHQISGAALNNYHQFWVEVIES